jgi:hypothetical protein
MPDELSDNLPSAEHPPSEYEWYQINQILASMEEHEGVKSDVVLIAGVSTEASPLDPDRYFTVLIGQREYAKMVRAVKKGRIPAISTTYGYHVMTHLNQEDSEQTVLTDLVAATIMDHPTFSTGSSFGHAFADSALKVLQTNWVERAVSKNPVTRTVDVFRKLRLLRDKKLKPKKTKE